jgi:hypothetical protein
LTEKKKSQFFKFAASEKTFNEICLPIAPMSSHPEKLAAVADHPLFRISDQSSGRTAEHIQEDHDPKDPTPSTSEAAVDLAKDNAKPSISYQSITQDRSASELSSSSDATTTKQTLFGNAHPALAPVIARAREDAFIPKGIIEEFSVPDARS